MFNKISKMFKHLPKRLAAFDFDYTIVDDNTDTVVRKLLPESEVEHFSETNWKCWTFYMQDIFTKLHKQNISEPLIANEIVKIQPVAGMQSLIKTLKTDLNFDVIIISDSNTYFIEKWLNNFNLKQHVDEVFSNPAQFVNDSLQIKPFHEQTECKLSPYNMCKYKILQEYLSMQKANGVEYKQVFFTGDGANDYCPIVNLSSTDIGCVRYGFKCFELLQRSVAGQLASDLNGSNRKVQAEIFIWTDGNELLNFIKDKIKKSS